MNQLEQRKAPVERVVYLSGYANDTTLRHQELDPSVPLLQKPFTSIALARTVRKALGHPVDG